MNGDPNAQGNQSSPFLPTPHTVTTLRNLDSVYQNTGAGIMIVLIELQCVIKGKQTAQFQTYCDNINGLTSIIGNYVFGQTNGGGSFLTPNR